MKLEAIFHRAILLAALILTRPLPVPAENQPPLKYTIGAILPLTGPGATLGGAVRDAMTVAYDHLDPALRSRLTLVFEDDSSQSAKAVAALEKMRANYKLTGVISALSNSSHALAPLTEREGLPLIAVAIDPSIAANSASAMVMWGSIKEQGRLLVDEALRRGYKTIAVVNTTHQGNIAMRDAFLAENHDQLKVALQDEFDVGNVDFRSFVTKLRGQKLDGIALFLHFGHLGLFAKQVRAAGLKLPLFGMNFQDLGAVKDSEGALYNQWFVHLIDPSPEFVKDYSARFPHTSLFGAGNGHDALLLFAQGLKEGVEPKLLGRYLQTIKDFHGCLGTYSATPEHLFSIRSTVKVVKAGSDGSISFAEP